MYCKNHFVRKTLQNVELSWTTLMEKKFIAPNNELLGAAITHGICETNSIFQVI